MAKRGRKNKYFTHVQPRLEEIGYWCRDGRTDEEICMRIGVGVSNFSRYKNEFGELKEVLKENKEIADYRVENALYIRACGFEYDEITEEPAVAVIVGNLRNGETYSKEAIRKAIDNAMIVTKKVKKRIAPDTAACMSWLTNRKRGEWRHITEQNIKLDKDIAKLLDKAEKRINGGPPTLKVVGEG